MSGLLGMTVADLTRTLELRKLRLPAEIGAFVALEVTEAMSAGPAAVRSIDVRVAEDGTVGVFATPNSAGEADSARSVVELLRTLLAAAGPGVPRALSELVEGGPRDGWGLTGLRDDLEAALVPLNRAAARRVLSRMVREARKNPAPPERGDRYATPDASLHRELDDLLAGVEQVEAAPPKRSEKSAIPPPSIPAAGLWSDRPSKAPAPVDEGLDDMLSDLEAEAAVHPSEPIPTHPSLGPSPPFEGHPTSRRDAAPAADLDPDLDATLAGLEDELGDEEATLATDGPLYLGTPTPALPPRVPPEEEELPGDEVTLRDAPRGFRPREAASPGAAPDAVSPRDPTVDLTSGLDETPRSGGGVVGWLLAFVAVIAVTLAVLAVMRPDLVDAALGRPPQPARTEPTAEELEAERRARLARYGNVAVTVEPEAIDAQVFLYVGRGPTEVEDLPSGLAYELVAIADGQAPARALLPAGSAWETRDDRPFVEMGMMAGPTLEDRAAQYELGPTQLRADALGSPGDLGTLRVVTTPPGARVYLLVGIADPRLVQVENVRTDEAVELLVYAEDHRSERITIGASDWVTTPEGTKLAELSVTLEERDPRRRRR
jgi:hypothetical protein